MVTLRSASARESRIGGTSETDASPGAPAVGDALERWLAGEERTLQSLLDAFGPGSFAIAFVVLLGVPALPLPTGGATHVFEVVAALLALELIAGRREVWLPARWRELTLAGERRERFVAALLRLVRRLERVSRPRGRRIVSSAPAYVVFGALVLGGAAAAFFAPPFSGLDTLPALGVVVLSLGMLLEDLLVVVAGGVIGLAGVAVEVALGAALLRLLGL